MNLYGKDKESKKMNRRYLLKRIAKDCIPTIFSLLMSGLYAVMDGLFVGRAVGDAGLAAINIAWPIAAVITASIFRSLFSVPRFKSWEPALCRCCGTGILHFRQ